MTVLGYCRVSTEQQAIGGLSLATQKEVIAAYCAAQLLPEPAWVVEAMVSGSKPIRLRPEGGRLFASGVKHIVVTRLDRLFRSTLDALATLAEWKAMGTTVHIIDMGGATVNTSTPFGKLILTVMAAIAELERAMVSERTLAVSRHLKASGRVRGKVPYGCMRQGKQLVDSVPEQAILTRMRNMVAAGGSLSGIATALNAEGRLPRDGKWHSSGVKRILERTSK